MSKTAWAFWPPGSIPNTAWYQPASCQGVVLKELKPSAANANVPSSLYQVPVGAENAEHCSGAA